jgi:signal transduction histidine kinase
VVVDASGAVVYANAMTGRLLGVPAADIVGKPAREVLSLWTEDGEDWWTCGRPLEGDARLAPRIPEVDVELRAGADRQVPVILMAARWPKEGSRELGQVVVLLRRADRRRRLDEARSDLVSTVSHEIRSPLTSVKGFSKTLLARWERFTDEQKRQMLATINEDADRVTRLLGELLDVSRIDAGRLRDGRVLGDVPLIAERVGERLTVGHDGALIRSSFSPVPQLYADPDKVEQVFTNLLENAVRHGGGTAHMTADVDDDEVRFTVSDEGPGIDEEHLGSVFMKFFGRSGERRAGTGLGLYITRGLVEAHGGRIWAESELGHGATFHFTLPRGGLELAGVDLDSVRDRLS